MKIEENATFKARFRTTQSDVLKGVWTVGKGKTGSITYPILKTKETTNEKRWEYPFNIWISALATLLAVSDIRDDSELFGMQEEAE